VEVDSDTLIGPMIKDAQVIAVCGAVFGDEGKGKTVARLMSEKSVTCVARTNSGENAGHTIISEEGTKFVFHLCPSGMLENKRNFVGCEAVMDPISFMETEVGQLLKHKISYKDKLFLGNVHIVAPYHKLLDMIASPINSSTLKGMSPIHASKVTKKGLRLDHIYGDESFMRRRLSRDMETYFGALAVRGMSEGDVLKMCEVYNSDMKRIPDHVLGFVTCGARVEDKVQYCVQLYKKHVVENAAFPERADVAHEMRQCLERGEKILLEGPVLDCRQPSGKVQARMACGQSCRGR
jgi:adenylosuccinate synthase